MIELILFLVLYFVPLCLLGWYTYMDWNKGMEFTAKNILGMILLTFCPAVNCIIAYGVGIEYLDKRLDKIVFKKQSDESKHRDS